jgi:hypothetical protein
MDYKDFDLAEARPELCQTACESDPECKAYTYVKPGVQGPHARCWLKSGVPKVVINDCCISGVKNVTVAEPPRANTLRVHAIKVADDDGGRAANITPQQVKAWVDKANSIYATAGVQFQFDPDPNGSDWSTLNNTTINNLSSSNSAAWEMANALAAQYPRSLVVFFRYGTGATPTGNGFAFPPQSGLITNFVAMPGFNNTSVITGKDAANQWIWQQNIWLFAHEVGHYLGLYHTFIGWTDSATDTPDKARRYIVASELRSERSLDGDGMGDTPPDAGTAFYINQGWDPCRGHDSYTIDGIYTSGRPEHIREVPFTYTFRPDRHNAMSYFACDPMHFTPMQIDLMRQTLQGRLAQELRTAPAESTASMQ